MTVVPPSTAIHMTIAATVTDLAGLTQKKTRCDPLLYIILATRHYKKLYLLLNRKKKKFSPPITPPYTTPTPLTTQTQYPLLSFNKLSFSKL